MSANYLRLRKILRKCGYVVLARDQHFSLLDLRTGQLIAPGYGMSLDDLGRWIDENLSVEIISEWGD